MFGAIAAAAGKAVDQGIDLYKNHSAISHADYWNNQNIALQKEFAQNSIRWRVEDAKRAGVHPMAALGISPASFSPVSSSLSYPASTSYLSDMGQNIDRAIQAGKDQEGQQKAEGFADSINALTLEKMGLENDILRQELASKKAVMRTVPAKPAPAINISKPFGDQIDAPSPAGSASTPAGIDTFNNDPSALYDLVIVGDSLVPVFNPDIADPLSESVHNSVAAKAAYISAINKREILGPPRSTWSKSQKDRVDSGRYHWVFDALLWKWYLEKNPAPRYEKGRKEVSGKLFNSDLYR